MRESQWKRFLEKALRFPFSSSKSSKRTENPESELIFSDPGQFQIGPSAYFLYNLTTGSFKEMDAAVEDISGIPAQEFIQRQASETITDMADLSHIEAIGHFIKKSFEYLAQQTSEDKISANIEHNIISRNGTRKRILVQYSPTGFNSKGEPVYNRGCITDITHIRNDGLPRLYLFKNNQLVHEESANPESVVKNSDIPLSKTEIRILQLISEGLIAKEIADKMEISISTLYKHRKNIKSKMGQDITRIISILKEKGMIYQLGAMHAMESIEAINPLF